VRIACAGGGPAGLYFAVLMKLWQPESDVTVFERNAVGVTHGWGVTWERGVLDRLAGLDAESAAEIERNSTRWRDQVIDFRGVRDVNGDNNDAHAISRQRFVDILAARASRLGVDIRYSHEIRDAAELPEADLIVAADGVNSLLRDGRTGFGTRIRTGRNKYTWLGTSKAYESFNFFFEQTEAGWIWAYAYPHEPTASTFIVECTPATWAALGFDNGPASMALDRLEKIFGKHLDGHRLTSRFPDGSQARWQNFRTVRNERWHDGRVALVGDSAHTAHYSVGLGTTLAIDDVIALAEQLRTAPAGTDLEPALAAYQQQRQSELRMHAIMADRSEAWFENLPRYAALPPSEFATVLHARRAPLLPYLPPRVFCQLNRARERFPAVDALRTLVSRLPKRQGEFVGPPYLGLVHRTRMLAATMPSRPAAKIAQLSKSRHITDSFAWYV
jgi:2-polyprenyl-6-methoxyphenol hydroxylase-like FAD-dependent oxidoreductase